jgi:undecaprenyl pyrophosphate phosphatase UppP
VLHKLTAARLLVCDGDGAMRAVEVAHEALIRKWPQLQAWVQADKQLLWELARVEEWLQAWRDYGTVLQGAQLAFAQQVAKKANASLSPAAQYMVRLFTLRAQRYRYVAVATLVLAILALLFDAVLPSALPQRARVVQDVLIAGCLLGLLNFTTAHVSLRRWRPR